MFNDFLPKHYQPKWSELEKYSDEDIHYIFTYISKSMGTPEEALEADRSDRSDKLDWSTRTPRDDFFTAISQKNIHHERAWLIHHVSRDFLSNLSANIRQARWRRNNKQVNISITAQNHKKLSKFAKSKKTTLNDAIERLLNQLID